MKRNIDPFDHRMMPFKFRSGPVYFGGGGSDSGSSYDAAYNARMATVAETELEMGETLFDFWESDYKAMEADQIAANRKLIPYETELQRKSLMAETELLPLKTETTKEFLNESLEGVDVQDRVDRAAADATQAFMNSNSIMRRNASRMGVNPSSDSFSAMANTNALNRTKIVAGAMTDARTGAEQENYGRLKSAMGYGE